MATLSPQQKSYLKYLGDFGDAQARAVYESLDTGDEKIVVLTDVAAAAAANLVASTFDNAVAALTIITTASGTPLHATHPRNVYATFGAAWAGGDIVVVGTDQFNTAVTETLAAATGTTVVGSKVFKTITSVTKTIVGAGGADHTVTLGSGSKLSLGEVALLNAFVQVIVGGATFEQPAAVDVANSTITFTTAPNATNDYQVLCRSVI